MSPSRRLQTKIKNITKKPKFEQKVDICDWMLVLRIYNQIYNLANSGHLDLDQPLSADMFQFTILIPSSSFGKSSVPVNPIITSLSVLYSNPTSEYMIQIIFSCDKQLKKG